MWITIIQEIFFCNFLGRVRLSPLGTSATVWPSVPAPDDRWWWVWNSRWNEHWQGKPKYSEKTYPSATLSTTNPTWPDLGLNPDRHGRKPATNRLSYGTALRRIQLFDDSAKCLVCWYQNVDSPCLNATCFISYLCSTVCLLFLDLTSVFS
jgi:hypothetical protein